MLKKKAGKFLVLLCTVVSLAGVGGKASYAKNYELEPKTIKAESINMMKMPSDTKYSLEFINCCPAIGGIFNGRPFDGSIFCGKPFSRGIIGDIEKRIDEINKKIKTNIPNMKEWLAKYKAAVIEEVKKSLKKSLMNNIVK